MAPSLLGRLPVPGIASALAALAREAADAGALPSPPGLSTGMSDDFEVAVEEGATVVRVGSALFG